MSKLHPCEVIYQIAGDSAKYGDTQGICRITGKPSSGLPFNKWVKKTFTNYSDIFPGDIISNEALFCFDEKSDLLREIMQKDKPQKFRTYSHFVHKNSWHVFTKANKAEMYSMLISEEQPVIAVMSDSGQTHLLFKHRMGFWQLEHEQVKPDPPLLKELMQQMQSLLLLGFSQTEVIEGNYKAHRIHKAGVSEWHALEAELKQHRDSGIFDIAGWLLHQPEEKNNSYEHKRASSGEADLPSFSLFG